MPTELSRVRGVRIQDAIWVIVIGYMGPRMIELTTGSPTRHGTDKVMKSNWARVRAYSINRWFKEGEMGDTEARKRCR
jgi:hypothetical protein